MPVAEAAAVIVSTVLLVWVILYSLVSGLSVVSFELFPSQLMNVDAVGEELVKVAVLLVAADKAMVPR